MNNTQQYGIELLWIPLGAGGWFVHLNGRMWEAVRARMEQRQPFDLYHTALIVRVPEGRFVIENAWPIPDAAGVRRGVVGEGPVFHPWCGVIRALRYEVRCWRDGRIDDAAWAVDSPKRITDDVRTAQRLLDHLPMVPTPVWGRQVLGTGDMWNSNSTIAWILTYSGVNVDALVPPAGGRAPGWIAGVSVARHDMGKDNA